MSDILDRMDTQSPQGVTEAPDVMRSPQRGAKVLGQMQLAGRQHRNGSRAPSSPALPPHLVAVLWASPCLGVHVWAIGTGPQLWAQGCSSGPGQLLPVSWAKHRGRGGSYEGCCSGVGSAGKSCHSTLCVSYPGRVPAIVPHARKLLTHPVLLER